MYSHTPSQTSMSVHPDNLCSSFIQQTPCCVVQKFSATSVVNRVNMHLMRRLLCKANCYSCLCFNWHYDQHSMLTYCKLIRQQQRSTNFECAAALSITWYWMLIGIDIIDGTKTVRRMSTVIWNIMEEKQYISCGLLHFRSADIVAQRVIDIEAFWH